MAKRKRFVSKNYQKQVSGYPYLEDNPKTDNIIEGADGMHRHIRGYGNVDWSRNLPVDEQTAQRSKNQAIDFIRQYGNEHGDITLPNEKKRKFVKKYGRK